MPDMSFLNPYIEFAMSHVLATLLVVAVVFTVLMLAVPRQRGAILETFFRSYLFWTLTLLFVRDAVRLGAFGPDAAAVLGPAPFPNLAAANLSLAFAVVSFLALAGSFGLRLAAIVGVGVSILAPFATAVPTTELVLAHLPEVIVVAIGVLLLVLQGAGVSRYRSRYAVDA